MSTILKWAGNKTDAMPELKKHLPAGSRLVEPFAGSCAVMMETDYPYYLVADINPDLINLYRQSKLNSEQFIAYAQGFFEDAKGRLLITTPGKILTIHRMYVISGKLYFPLP